MKSIMQDIQEVFQTFIRNPRERLMVVSCEPENSPLLLKTLDALEEEPTNPDIFLIFGHHFKDFEEYVREMMAPITEQIAGLNEEMKKRGEPLLPSLPDELTDESLIPQNRLVALLHYVRRTVPADRRVIWTIYPIEIGSPAAYLEMIGFFKSQFEDRSLPGFKLIARDRTNSPILTPKFEGLPEVEIYHPGLDPDTLEKKITEKANDPRIPAEEQAQLHMMLAGYDVANQRFDQALARNLELLGYFRSTGQQHHQSILLNNIGDLHYIQNRFTEAQSWYERAIGLSVQLQSQPLVLYQSINLGNALFVQKKFDDALLYFKAADQLAQATNAPVQQIQALEKAGLASYQAGRADEAAEAWEKAADVSRKLQYKDGLQPNLEHLRKLYRETGNAQRHEACDRELKALTAEK